MPSPTEAPAVHVASEKIATHPAFFGQRRPLAFGHLERHVIEAGDGATLHLHHVPGEGSKGPVVLTAGTAMSALSFCIDTVEQNAVEYLAARGHDVWLLDWRTSPELPVHLTEYSMDDVARFDLPAGIEAVRARTGADEVGVVAHCLSSTAFHTALVRGYLPSEHVNHLVASQVALHLVYNWVNRIKRWTYADKLVPKASQLHYRPDEITWGIGDTLIGFLSLIIPKSYKHGTKTMHRHSATFGDLLRVPQVGEATIQLMADLIPEITVAFLRDVQSMTRRRGSLALTRDELAQLDRLALPITYIVGEHNNMFVPEATKRTYDLLCEKNGADLYAWHQIERYGHLDCFVGDAANADVFPLIGEALDGATTATTADDAQAS